MSQSIQFQVLATDYTPLADRQVPAPQVLVFRDLPAWTQFWQSSTRRDLNFQPYPAPAVDFTTHMVVGVTAGSHPTGGYSLKVNQIEAVSSAAGDRWVVHYTEQTPDPQALLTQQPTTPAVLLLTPRSQAVVKLQPA